MRRIIIIGMVLFANILMVSAQDSAKTKPVSLTMEQYEKAKTFSIKDLDKDTYAKFENTYILDRYEMRKPYFITGDDGAKKRIDIYKLILKDGMQELGTMLYYSNEKGKIYTVLQPSFTTDKTVWNQYFNDIDNINKVETNFVLKLSYILSKEMSFQLYKALNQGKDLNAEMATYGTDICFPGDQEVAMADGSIKQLNQIKAGDQVITVDPVTKKAATVTVTKLVQHEAKNYAITKLLVVSAKEMNTNAGTEIQLSGKLLSATPNHPMKANGSVTNMGNIVIGDEVLCLDEKTNTYKTYTVFNKTEAADGVQKVYNMETVTGNTFIMNGVMVMQK
ncbi:MAG: Hint domain-containing protein [Ferruginibacter sp.]